MIFPEIGLKLERISNKSISKRAGLLEALPTDSIKQI